MKQKSKYMEIYDRLKGEICQGVLAPGERIYSENELMQMFLVSRQTVRQAVSRLETEGLVVRKRGSGTYVSEKGGQECPPVRSRQIAVVTTYIDEYIFPKIIKSIEETVSEKEYTLQVAFTHNSVEMERRILRKLSDEHIVSGLIIESTKSALPNPNIGLYRELMAKGIPVLFLNSYYPDLRAPHVSMDDRQAGRAAAEFLVRKGHKKIGAVFKSDDGQGHLRYQGYMEALLEAGIEVREENILWIATGDVEEMEREQSRYLARLKGITACVCYNDTVASNLMDICLHSGIRIPDDLSVMGIDDADISKDLSVPLTTVHNPLHRLGRLSGELILKMIQGERVPQANEMEGTIVERGSVKTYGA